jgi:hypothetical protein
MHICRAFDLESGQLAAAPHVIVLSFTDTVVVKYGSCDLMVILTAPVGLLDGMYWTLSFTQTCSRSPTI